MKRLVGLLVLVITFVGCAPAITSVDVSKNFVLVVGEQRIEPNATGSYGIGTEQYSLQLSLDQTFISYTLTNKTSETIKILFDESAIIQPSGQSSRALPGNASYTTRNDAQPPVTIPGSAKNSGVLFPSDNISFEGGTYGRGLVIGNMFNFPLTSSTTVGLLLTLEISGTKQELNVQFVGQP
jgi:hypothetical protein